MSVNKPEVKFIPFGKTEAVRFQDSFSSVWMTHMFMVQKGNRSSVWTHSCLARRTTRLHRFPFPQEGGRVSSLSSRTSHTWSQWNFILGRQLVLLSRNRTPERASRTTPQFSTRQSIRQDTTREISVPVLSVSQFHNITLYHRIFHSTDRPSTTHSIRRYRTP